MKIGERVKTMLQNWLEIMPAVEQTVILNEKYSRNTEILRSQLWYRGDSNELRQFFSQTDNGSGGFWASVPESSRVRKIHSGLPAIIADTLAYIIKSDLDAVTVSSDDWDKISDKIKFVELVGDAIVDTLVDGDGAFKISIDMTLSPYPIVEFVGGGNVEFETERGIITAIVFKSVRTAANKKFILHERYSRNRIESRLYDLSGREHPLDAMPELAGIPPVTEFSGDCILAVPLKFYKSPKYTGRGKPVFSGGRSDNFDALDEVISQWIDAVRDGRVQKYIPEDLIPRNPDNGSLGRVNSFGTQFVKINSSLGDEASSRITTVQPEIRYEAFAATYINILLLCLQGILSPATLGIDVGKMSSADAQREKKDVTGDTRNTITTALEAALPKLVEAVLIAYDNMLERPIGNYEAKVSFGEYGAPDFDSRIETVGKAGSYGVMSVETQVEELWGSSKDDEWKAAEVARIRAERGLTADEPAVNDDAYLP